MTDTLSRLIKPSRIEKAIENIFDETGLTIGPKIMELVLHQTDANYFSYRTIPALEKYLSEMLSSGTYSRDEEYDLKKMRYILCLHLGRCRCEQTAEIIAYAMDSAIEEIQSTVDFWRCRCENEEYEIMAKLSTITNFIYKEDIWQDAIKICKARVG